MTTFHFGKPGPKTDMKEAEWTAQLHHGEYLKDSLIPMGVILELREYTRPVSESPEEGLHEVEHIYMNGNIRLSSICSLKSVSGMKVLRTRVDG